MGKKKNLSFVEYMKRFLDDKTTDRGAVARRVWQEKDKGNEIDSLSALMIWLYDGNPFTMIEDARISENRLADIWAEYCAAAGRPFS